jgi:zinc protease
MRLTSLLLATAVGGAALAADASASMFRPETFTLDNGMEVVVVTNRRAPVVSHWVWYRVGSADSPLGKSGLPHFVEHLMFKGTENLEPGEFSRIVARNGGTENAMTSNDFTAYFQNIAKDRLELVMSMEADRMANLKLTDAEVYPERDVVLEERRSRVDNDPGARLAEQLSASLYVNHPYGNPVIGWYHEIAGYTRADAEAFHREWYAPNNAILIVVGDVDGAEVRPLAEATYGKVPAREVPVRERLVEPEPQVARRLELTDPRVGQESLSRAYLAPSQRQAGWEQAHALDLFAEILGGGTTSILYRELVMEQELAASAGAYYRGTSLDDTAFRVYAVPREGVTLQALEAALDAILTRVLAEGVSELDAERAKRRMQAEAVYAQDSLSGAARIIGSAVTSGLTVEDVEAWPTRIGTISVEAINGAGRSVLLPERSVTGLLRAPAREGIGVAGDITAEELAPLLDQAFAHLPAEAKPAAARADAGAPARSWSAGSTCRRAWSPSACRHRPRRSRLLRGLCRQLHPRRRRLRVPAHRGGAREARPRLFGLFLSHGHRPRTLWMGGVATKNDQVAQSIDVIKGELAGWPKAISAEADLANAKTYLTGSFPLRFTSNENVARILVGMQANDLGIDYPGPAQRLHRGGDPGDGSPGCSRVEATRLFAPVPSPRASKAGSGGEG